MLTRLQRSSIDNNAIDRIVAELWPEYHVGNLPFDGPVKAALPPHHEGESGFPSAVRGAGAEGFGVPSGFFGKSFVA